MSNRDHYVEKCECCGRVMGQCRCFDANKRLIWNRCEGCKNSNAVPHARQTQEKLAELRLNGQSVADAQTKVDIGSDIPGGGAQ